MTGGGSLGGPTLGTLEYKIMTDSKLEAAQRQMVLNALSQETAGMSKSTPLKSILPGLGGGVLGFLIGQYFKMGLMGRALSTALGYGIGTTVRNFYRATGKVFPVGARRL